MPDFPYEGDEQELMEQDIAALMDENPEASDMAASGAVQSEVVSEQPEGELPEELQKALMDLVDNWERADEDAREPLLMKWKLMERFWNDEHHNVWSEFAQDWRSIEDYEGEDDLDLEGFEPRTINIYKAHGESVIAAMSAGLPVTRFFPNDADSQDDVSTAKVWSRAAELIQRRNKAPLLLIRALYILWNQGCVASYNYCRSDPKLGTVVQPIYGQVKQTVPVSYCPECGNDMQGIAGICQNCGYEGNAEIEELDEMVPGVVDQKEYVRITEDIKVYSPLYFRIPHRATEQAECKYLTLDTEQSPGAVIAAFKADIADIREKVQPTKDEEKYDRWARNLTGQTYGDQEFVTVRQRWIRSWGLEEIENEEHREELLKRFPNGVYLVQAGENFITARDENMDDHWTISMSPTSPHLLAQALGYSLKTINEMTNELATMTMDNISHQTPMTMVDSELLNLQKFKTSRTAPGMVYPVKVPPGSQIGHFIHESRPATLSEEVRYFSGELKEFGQFTSGAFPSIYGGVMQGGSGTAKEYEMSRAQALQRLQITWRIVNEWWSEMTGKSVKDYLEHLRYDERMVKPHGNMGFINVWIRKSEATGKIGEVIAESSEQFPTSWAQKRDILINLLNLKDENIAAAIFHPENTGVVAQTLGFPEFYIPGDDDRSKQLNEIADLLASTAMPVPGPMGQMTFLPSVMPDAKFDNHPVHMETIKAFAVSEIGIQVKKENPMGYQNLIAHYIAHEQAMMMQAIQQGLLGGPTDDGAESADAEEPPVEAPAEEPEDA